MDVNVSRNDVNGGGGGGPSITIKLYNPLTSKELCFPLPLGEDLPLPPYDQWVGVVLPRLVTTNDKGVLTQASALIPQGA